MLFATLLGVLFGGAAVLLLEQWLRADLAAVRPAVEPRPARPSRATTSIALRRLPPR